HLVEAGEPSVDEIGLPRVLGLEQRGGGGEAAPGILALVPCLGADGGEKFLHRRLVAGEEAAVEMTRVPVDEDAAEIEDDDRARWVHGGTNPMPGAVMAGDML